MITNKKIFYILFFCVTISVALLVRGYFFNKNFPVVKVKADNAQGKKIAGGSENTSNVNKIPEKSEKFIKLMFLGDFMLDRSNRNLIDRRGLDWMTKEISNIFLNKDLIVINLEGTITDKNSVSVGTVETEKGHFIFTFNPERTKNFLEENKIGIANLGNNHITNFGAEGVLETKKNLQNFGVDYFGDPTDQNNFLVKDIEGMKIGFVNYNAFSKINSAETMENIRKAKKQSNFVIVYTHWGAEYALLENETQRKLAHDFIDNGADLIIGTHPHVIQPVEIYKNKAIFYSLGNFIFDQYFSEDVKERLAVGGSISKDKTEFYLEPLYLEKNGQLVLAEEERRENILKRISQKFQDGSNEKKSLQEGKLIILKEK